MTRGVSLGDRPPRCLRSAHPGSLAACLGFMVEPNSSLPACVYDGALRILLSAIWPSRVGML